MIIRPRILFNQIRRYSVSTSTVPLSFTRYDADIIKNPPLIICHGLFGSKQNWRSLAKTLSAECNCQVFTLDARNHGESPHNNEHTYDLMGNDLMQFIRENDIQNPVLMGHSMGGKVIMNVALRKPEIPSKLVVIDMAPVKLQLTREYSDHIQGMRDIQAKKLTKQREADSILQKVEPDLIIRQFLLTNLKKNRSDGVYQFRIPYDILDRSLSRMGGFDFQYEPATQYQGPTLFITGGLSPFRKQFLEYPETIKALFPNSTVQNIKDAGHWVQTEKPQEFLEIATDFINNKQRG